MNTKDTKKETPKVDYKYEHIEPAIIVIFGITGDLSRRKLLPSLYELVKNNLLAPGTKVVGITRGDSKIEPLMDMVEESICEKDKTCDKEALKKLRAMTSIRQMDLTKPEHYYQFLDHLDDIEKESGTCMSRLFYLAVPPGVLMTIVKRMGKHGLNKGCVHGKLPRILFEKPFGHDLRSGEELIAETAQYFEEEQVFRIDHYIAKETVQNILTFRFHNPIFVDIWNAAHIDRIEITAAEELDIEGRAIFYEQTGALRDLVQSHLLQLLTSLTMEEPKRFTSTEVHKSKVQLLKDVVPVRPDEVSKHTLRAQYDGYKDEVKNDESVTETFAALRLFIENERWYGVPIIIKTGKALDKKETDVKVHFRAVDRDHNHLNTLIFHIQPDEGITVRLWVKQPGFLGRMKQEDMVFSYQQAFDEHGHPDAYERVLVDSVKGDRTRFATGDEILAAWEIIEEVVEAWGSDDEGMKTYTKGSKGPALPSEWYIPPKRKEGGEITKD